MTLSAAQRRRLVGHVTGMDEANVTGCLRNA